METVITGSKYVWKSMIDLSLFSFPSGESQWISPIYKPWKSVRLKQNLVYCYQLTLDVFGHVFFFSSKLCFPEDLTLYVTGSSVIFDNMPPRMIQRTVLTRSGKKPNVSMISLDFCYSGYTLINKAMANL